MEDNLVILLLHYTYMLSFVSMERHVKYVSLCTMYDTSIFKYARESTICPGKEGGGGGGYSTLTII